MAANSESMVNKWLKYRQHQETYSPNPSFYCVPISAVSVPALKLIIIFKYPQQFLNDNFHEMKAAVATVNGWTKAFRKQENKIPVLLLLGFEFGLCLRKIWP